MLMSVIQGALHIVLFCLEKVPWIGILMGKQNHNSIVIYIIYINFRVWYLLHTIFTPQEI